ncbi:NADPH-dependent FMN reductase [Streptomyces sp. NPDC006314]|uniref:NADPH-dependent FMN reductase n=1 Tax=Streptomyces sp. NPDC006314 TaxID=3154475 RepID=UPI0033AC5567
MTVRMVAIGGSLGSPSGASTTEAALRCAASVATALGAEVEFFTGERLRLPPYDPSAAPPPAVSRMLAAVAGSDALLVASPAYHGGVSGLVKNALDYLEGLRQDSRPYLEQRAVGCIGVGAGAQGAAATLHGLRQIVHALRGWPTPLGVAVSTEHDRAERLGTPGGLSAKVVGQLETLGAELFEFARIRRAAHNASPPLPRQAVG